MRSARLLCFAHNYAIIMYKRRETYASDQTDNRLAKTNEISDICHAHREPIFITKNGYGDLVVMSIETYEEMLETATTDAAIAEAEAEYNKNGQLHDARTALTSLKRKHFG